MSAATIIPLPTPLQGMSTRDLESELLGLAGHIAAAECRFLQLLAERDGWAGDGIRSCARWLSWRAGMSLRTATEHLRVAHLIHDHGYRIRRRPGRWEFCRPDGSLIPTVAAPLTGNTDSLIEIKW